MIDNFQNIIAKFGELYVQGMLLTLQLSAMSLFAGFFLAWLLALALLDDKRAWLQLPSRAFVYFMTGTPLLVQLFLVYYGLAQFEAVRESFLWLMLREPYWCAFLVFALNTAAYSARIFHGAMSETERGELEAAIAYGLPPFKRLTHIIIPAAWRRALPAYGNEMIFLLHGSSLASVVTLLDLTGAARVAARGTFNFTESYLLAIVLYMSLTGIIVITTRIAEKHATRHLRPITL